MKRSYWAILALILITLALGMITACDQSRTPVEVNAPVVPTDPVVIIDDTNRSVTIIDPAVTEKPVIITATEYSQTYTCGDAEVVSETNYVRATWPGNNFEASFEKIDDTHHLERYTYNGVVLELVIDEFTGPTAEQIAQYQAFYPPQVLHPDAEALVKAFERAQPQLAEVVQARSVQNKKDGLPDMQLRPGWADYMCGTAQACFAIACRLGPNPVCLGCASVVVGCIIMDMFGWW